MPCHRGVHIPQQLRGRQLLRQHPLKGGISSIAGVLGLASVALAAFVPILTLFVVQTGEYANVRVRLGCGWGGEGVVGGGIISVGIEK